MMGYLEYFICETETYWRHITGHDTESDWIMSQSLKLNIQYEWIKYFKNYINTYKIILIYILTISPSSAN
jgi:hypothetical protein